MVSLSNPRTTTAFAIIALIGVTFIFLAVGNLPNNIQFVLILFLSFMIAMAAYNFAAKELKETAGVSSTLELGVGRMFIILMFAFFITIGYDTFFVIIVSMFEDVLLDSQIVSVLTNLITISILYLTIYPFFQTLNLARAGEQSSIPSDFIIEKAAEYLTDKVRSPVLSAILLYFTFYIIPIAFMSEFILGELILSIFLWSLLLPLISVSALAGAGLGEDLIRLKLIRNPLRDLKKLGMPKISIKERKVDIGGLFLVLLAIQAIITTIFFGVRSVAVAFNIGTIGASAGLGVGTILLVLFNKGRGATKEIKEVWQESGFKVSAFQLFLPVFVFLGVILSSILEVFINNNPATVKDIMAALGINSSGEIKLVSIFLAVQNLFLVFTAITIFRITPGTAERRLIKEIPKFYVNEDGGPDLEGYLYIYRKLKSDRSVENMLKEISKTIRSDISQVDLLKGILTESLTTGSTRVQVAASETLYQLFRRLDSIDQDFRDLAKIAMNSKYAGSRIYALRSYKILVKTVEGEEKESLIKEIVEHLNDADDVVAWDSGLLLQKIIKEDEKYRSFILAFVIKTLIETENQSTINSITRFLRKIADESQIIGQMAISTLGVQLQIQEKSIDNLILGIRAILRGNPSLALDLLDQVSVGITHPELEHRKNSYIVLMNMAEYSEGLDGEIINLILEGIKDPSDEIQEIAYNALKKEVNHSKEVAMQVYDLLTASFESLRGVPLLGALDVLEEIADEELGNEDALLDLIKGASNSSLDPVRVKVYKIFAKLVETKPTLGDEIFQLSEDDLEHGSERVRQYAITAMGRAVSAFPDLARVVYRKVSNARNDSSFKVQLAAIEALGYVASANQVLSSEIFENLKPLLDDTNWQVRLASFNGLVAATKKRKDLYDDLVNETIKALTDNNNLVREGGFGALEWLIPVYRQSADKFIQVIKKIIRTVSEDVLATLYNALEIIAERRITQLGNIIPLIHYGFSAELSAARYNAINTLKTATSKLAKAREPSKTIHKDLDKLVTSLLKVANNSNPAVRSSAYDGLIELCVAIPSFKVATRGRRSLTAALKHERDVGLIEQLERGLIRAKPPLNIDI